MDPYGFEEEKSEPNARQLRQTRAKPSRSAAKKSIGTRSKPAHHYNSSSGKDIRAKTLRSKAALAKKAGKPNPHGPTSSPAASASVLTSTPIGRDSGSRRASRTSRTWSRTRSALSTSTPASSSARPSPAFDASHIPIEKEKENVRRRRGSRSQSQSRMSMSFLNSPSPRLTEPNVSAVLSSSMDCTDTSPLSCCNTSVARSRTPAKPDRKNGTTRGAIKSNGKCNPTHSSRRRLQSNLDFNDEGQETKKSSSIPATSSKSEELEKLRAQFSDIDNFSLEVEVL